MIVPTTAMATIVELGGAPTNLATTTAGQHGQAVVIVTPRYMNVAIPQGYTAGQSFLVPASVEHAPASSLAKSTLGLSGGGGGGRESILGGGGGGASAGQRGLVGSAAAVVGVLCLCRAARKRRPPLSVVALLLPLLLLLLARRVGATTCSEALASDYACYDPAGASCTCSGGIYLYNDGLTGTLPAALSACTGVTGL